ncbi:hypothetical protein GS597_13010 [Synechococcales cyanobacterium C]|uniref:Uncharacterized protein n=1 Tax=Petrachloros mirabilis ULC683 TaxID=2781853 RepID=A0A8K2A0C5_9CYAN|nr:hypothetical protein [Petrachloros mirabilis]NCJ07411.1 hypothetical protein [Petrachloros mirabilis ULC683]
MLSLLQSPAPVVQLPTQLAAGAWSCCHLRLLGSGWAELAGVPFPSAAATVERLQGLGASRVSIAGSGTQLCVIRFQAQRSVLLQLSAKFPSACRVA